MNENEGYMKFLPAGLVAIVLGVAALLLLRRPRKPRSFREDPVGALKDRSEIVAGKAQEATEEALARIQETIEEIRGRLPDVNRKQFDKRRKQVNQSVSQRTMAARQIFRELVRRQLRRSVEHSRVSPSIVVVKIFEIFLVHSASFIQRTNDQ